ncbi:MAG: carboxymuconolactone decarboxylase family protein [Dehalococcoidia bacterium]
MARVGYIEKDQADPKIREAFQHMEARGQSVLNVFKVMANCPHIGLNFLRLGNSILTGEEVPAAIRELAIIRVGLLAQSKYEVHQHIAIGLLCGVRQKQIDDLAKWTRSKEFNEKERAVLQYTDEVAQNVKVKDKTFATLKQYFSDHAIVELTTTIGYYGMVSRILVALQVEIEAKAG